MRLVRARMDVTRFLSSVRQIYAPGPDTVIWFSTSVTPGVDQAARQISSCSAQDRTQPERSMVRPLIATRTFRKLMRTLSLNASSILASTRPAARAGLVAIWPSEAFAGRGGDSTCPFCFICALHSFRAAHSSNCEPNWREAQSFRATSSHNASALWAESSRNIEPWRKSTQYLVGVLVIA